MRYYETLYLIRPDIEAEEYKGVIEKFNKIIESNNGKIIKVEEWGKRALAYEVKKFKDGFYVLVKFYGDRELPDKLIKDFRLDERILKFIISKLKDRIDTEELKEKEETESISESKEKKEVKAQNGNK